ncbi:MAG: DUF6020 family protein [Lachnospiraceae bacterium]|nr:DUF6020 family protein [Lachnospiraceae bacterium]
MKTIKPVNFIFGILFSLSIVLGFQCEFYGELLPSEPKVYVFIVILFVVATAFSKLFWDMIKDRGCRENIESETEDPKIAVKETVTEGPDMVVNEIPPRKRIGLYSAITVWILHFIVFLGVYPGFFVYDAFEELTETITRSFTDQHPIFHVLSMGAVIQGMHKVTGDYNISIAVFILFQMSINAVILGLVVRELYEEGLGRIGAIVFSIYFGSFPVLLMCDLCSAKDCLFTGALVLFTVYLRRLFKDPEMSSVKGFVKTGLCALFVMLLRSNGIYAIAVFLICIVIFFIVKAGTADDKAKRAGKRFLLTMVVSIVIYFAANTAMLYLTHAERVGHREILTVPIMQLSRVYAYDNESMSGADKGKLESYIPKENLLAYTPKCSDLVKIGFDEQAFAADKSGFLRLWARTGISHPIAYLNAFLMTGYGMWYPNATIDGYEGRQVFTFTYGKSSYFGYETEPPGCRDSKIPVIDRFFRFLSIEGGTRAVPVLHLLFSPGFMLWVYLFVLGYFIYAKEWGRFFSYLTALIVIATCFIGPMSLVRYAFNLWILVPVSFADMMMTKHKITYGPDDRTVKESE